MGNRAGLVRERAAVVKSGIQKRSEKEDANHQAQRLLLTWLCEEPAVYDKISSIIEPGDFTEELYRQVAEMLFAQLESGKRNPGEILNHFINDEEQYKEVAAIFNTKLKEGMTKEERNRAFRETVLRVKKNGLDYASRNVQDVAQLQAIISAQKTLKTLNISLD